MCEIITNLCLILVIITRRHFDKKIIIKYTLTVESQIILIDLNTHSFTLQHCCSDCFPYICSQSEERDTKAKKK